MKRLLNGLAGAIKPARSDRAIGSSVERLNQALSFDHGGGPVGVGEHDDIAGGLQDSIAHGMAFAKIAGILDQVQPRIAIHLCFDDGSRVVFGAIVNDENLGVPSLLLGAAQNALQGSFDARPFVVSWNDYAEVRM